MRVLFVYPDLYVTKSPNGHVSYEPAGWYNEGLASLSAALKQHGHETALYHLLCPPTWSDFGDELQRRRPDLVALNANIQQKPGIPIKLKADANSPTA